MNREIARAEQRTRQYWYDDGLTEIAVSIIFLAIAGLFLVEASAPSGSIWARSSAIGLVIVVVAGQFAANRGVKWAKNAITYPRTGYIRYRRVPHSGPRRAGALFLGAMVSMGLVVFLAATAPASIGWISAMQGLFIGLFILYMGYRVGILRFYLLAGFSLLVGLAVSLSGLGDTPGNAIYFAATGSAILLSGGLTLLAYLRGTRPAGGE